MFQNRKIREIIKSTLVASNIGLIILLISLSVFGAYHIKQKMFFESEKNNQFYTTSLDSKEMDDQKNKDLLSMINDSTNKSTAKIAIVITDLGMNKHATQMAFSLPAQITFGFIPYANSIKLLAKKAAEKNHDIYIYLPLEAKDLDYPGKFPILTTQNKDTNLQNIKRLLKENFDNIKGIYTRPLEIFTNNSENLLFLHNTLDSIGLKLLLGSYKESINHLEEDIQKDILFSSITLDNVMNEESVRSNLKQVIALSKIHKKVICYARAYPMTISVINEWLNSDIAENRDIQLVKISDLLYQ